MELRYCLGDGMMRSKTIKNSNLQRNFFDIFENKIFLKFLETSQIIKKHTEMKKLHFILTLCLIGSVFWQTVCSLEGLSVLTFSMLDIRKNYECYHNLWFIIIHTLWFISYNIQVFAVKISILIYLKGLSGNDIFNRSGGTGSIWNVVRIGTLYFTSQTKTTKK